jgi:large-conductance mechanosensitive channel
MRKFFGEFKKFITRGNVIDLAVAVIIAGAFTAIVTAVTSKILTPCINGLIRLCTGGKDVTSIYTFLFIAYNADGTIDYKIDDNKCLRCTECVAHFNAGCYMRKVLGIKRS